MGRRDRASRCAKDGGRVVKMPRVSRSSSLPDAGNDGREMRSSRKASGDHHLRGHECRPSLNLLLPTTRKQWRSGRLTTKRRRDREAGDAETFYEEQNKL